jgi:predicted MPP superfamily phosphohydrolase
MSRTFQYITFYGIFFIVFFGMHLYVYLRLKKLFVFPHPMIFFCAIILLALSFPVFSLLEKFFANTFTMILYTMASVWLGILFLMLSALVVYEPVRLILRVDSKITGIVIVSIVLMVSVYAIINAMFIKVKTVDIPLPNLDRPLKAALLSDIHVGTIHNSGYLKKIVDKTNALNPDMVLITGDLFDGLGSVNRQTVEPLNNLKARTFFTIGNHEVYYGPDRVEDVLASTNVVLLRNEVTEYKGIQIVGVDNPLRENQKDNPVLQELIINRAVPSVLMYHPPSGLEDALQAGINLQVSGHTHSGQLFPFTLLTKLYFPRTKGLHRTGNMYLYISSGTGTWGPPMRLGSGSEITLINLVPET